MIDTIFFDLDGTLLPMDNDIFTKGYFKGLVGKLAPYGYDPKQIVDGVWRGTAAMVKNDGSRPNKDAFWATFEPFIPNWNPAHRALTDTFYSEEFREAKRFTGENPLARPLIDTLKRDGLHVVLATNPLFPANGIETRLNWIGLTSSDFELVTTYENMHYCKPNPKYYTEILEMLGKKPEECLMVGNNTDEDCAAAQAAGMKTILVTDCLINESCTPVATYKNTTFADLYAAIRSCL
ncbi:MAG: HAD family hydrolase [Ruminococcus bromii]|nr:HAD family hydrolase [Ruminococcus bromii]